MVLTEQLENSIQPRQSFTVSFRTALQFLANPHKIWASGNLHHKKTVLKLAFTDRIAYLRGEGFRTAKTALPFKVLEEFYTCKDVMAGRVGFEPTKDLHPCRFSRPVHSTTLPPARTENQIVAALYAMLATFVQSSVSLFSSISVSMSHTQTSGFRTS